MRKQLKLLTSILVFIAMLLDAHLSRMFIAWNQGSYSWNTHLLLLVFLFAAAALPKRYLLITSFIIGCLFDSYYLGVLGVYAVTIPFVVWFMYMMRRALYQNLFSYFFGMIVLITGFDAITTMIQVVFKLTQVQSGFFIARFLGPTLLINIVLFFILYVPLRKLFDSE